MKSNELLSKNETSTKRFKRLLWVFSVISLFILGFISVEFYYNNFMGHTDGEPLTPIMQLTCEKTSNHTYRVEIINTTDSLALTYFVYYLQDENRTTREYGEIALSNYSGKWGGIDITWDDNRENDTHPQNGMSDRGKSAGGPYSDPGQAQQRINDVINGSQRRKNHQRNEGAISVIFFDNDLNSLFSINDYFIIKGNDDIHPANDSFTFLPLFLPTLDFSGCIQLG